jgi:hypothetical protein
VQLPLTRLLHNLLLAFIVTQGVPREFTKWGTLRQRLKEVKQSAHKLDTQPDSQQLQLLPLRRATQDSDASSTVMSDTCSAMEAKIEQLLAQPLVPSAVIAVAKAGATAADGSTAAGGVPGAGAAAAGGGAAGTLNLIVRRWAWATVMHIALLLFLTALASVVAGSVQQMHSLQCSRQQAVARCCSRQEQ